MECLQNNYYVLKVHLNILVLDVHVFIAILDKDATSN